MRETEEIEGLLHGVRVQIDESASRWAGATYEEGVRNALRWVLEEVDVSPLDDDAD